MSGMTQADWQAEVERRIAINEGRRTTVYHDTEGIPTIGIGFNLERSDARTALAGIGADYDKVLAGEQLTDDQVDKLFAYSFAPIEADARASLQPTHFDALSDARRYVICDLVFNLGSDGWLQFINTRAVIDRAVHADLTGDADTAHALFGQAADALTQSAWYEQVGDRAVRDVAMIRSSDWVPAE